MSGLGPGDGRHMIKHEHTIRSSEMKSHPITGFYAEDIHPEHQGIALGGWASTVPARMASICGGLPATPA
jgi:hypothetical protein